MEVATMSSDAQRKAASRYIATKKKVTIIFDPPEAYIVGAVAQRMERDANSAPKSAAGVLPPEVEDRLE